MKIDECYDKFLEALHARFVKKSQLAVKLMELLNIERGAVYRRLSKTIPFTFYEIVKIAIEWNISLDHIFNLQSEKIPFLMLPINYADPSDKHLDVLYQIVHPVHLLKDTADTEIIDVCNKLPRNLYAGFRYLYRFYLFKWCYEYSVEKKTVTFSEVTVSEKTESFTNDYYQAIKNVHITSFIFDRCLFDYLVNDIQYYHSIRMITDEEKEFIKQDLYLLLNYLWEIASEGCYPDTQNHVNLYVSHLQVNTNYSYMFSNQLNVCYVPVFDKFELYTYNPKMVSHVKRWMQLKKRTSFQISEVDEKCRVEYFSRQRQLVDTL